MVLSDSVHQLWSMLFWRVLVKGPLLRPSVDEQLQRTSDRARDAVVEVMRQLKNGEHALWVAALTLAVLALSGKPRRFAAIWLAFCAGWVVLGLLTIE